MTHTPYIWDSWYWYDKTDGQFHVYYLNVDEHALAAVEQHHFHARIGYATTQDFVEYDYHYHAAVTATEAEKSRDNTAIWTGCSVAYGNGTDRLMAFTSRDAAQSPVEGRDDPHPFTQHISFATSSDGRHWERVDGAHVDADPRFYSTESIVGDVVIHAWRDPILFRIDGDDHAYMLLCAHGKDLPSGVKDERNGAHGVIALLKSSAPRNLTQWVATGVSFAVDVPEAEVPRIYVDARTGKHIIAYSCKNAEAYVPHTPDKTKIAYGFYGFAVDMAAIAERIRHKPADESLMIHVKEADKIPLLAYGEDTLYACQVIPELGGKIMGFDTNAGVMRLSDVRVIDWLRPANADFREFTM
jgi:hypothetical protein